jgi:hypothetical protein
MERRPTRHSAQADDLQDPSELCFLLHSQNRRRRIVSGMRYRRAVMSDIAQLLDASLTSVDAEQSAARA